ncbi:MAG: MFS transporter [Anaerolineae bacterium]|nr:MFS transporter [Anaerolineae bacterium]
MLRQKYILVIICGALVVTISMGVRQAFGIFLQPISDDLGTGREVYSLAIALQNIILGLPLMAMIADRFGSRWIVLAGGVVYVVSLLLVPVITGAAGLYLSLGLMAGLALSSTTYVVVLGAIAQMVPPERRTSAFGITTAAGSLGMFLVVPVAQALLTRFGWQTSFVIMAAIVSLIVVLAFGFPNEPADDAQDILNGFETNSLPQMLAKAGQHSGYWLLNAGFFVCGFHVAFIATHLPAFLADQGVSPMAGATALALIGLSNVFGSYLFGWLGDRYRKKTLLAMLYFTRAIVIALFLLLPITDVSSLIFGGAIGFLWLATVPLTSGMVAQIFGSRYMTTLYGIVFFWHQVGSFLGVWLGGRVYDTTGSYNSVWIAAVVLGVVAAVIHLPISERPLTRGVVEKPVGP